MLSFSGRIQLVFVLRWKMMAKFTIVLQDPSFFKLMPLTHRNHNKLPIRSVFAKNLEKFRLMSENSRKNKKVFRKFVFPKMFSWSPLMLLWNSGQKFFGKTAQTLSPKIRDWQNIPSVYREKKIASKCSSGHLECSLLNAAGKRSSQI